MGNKLFIGKGIVTALLSLLGDKLELIFPVLLLLCTLMIVDYISGMLASKKEAIEHPSNKKYGWSSKKSIVGIYKKVGYVLTILVALSADYLIFDILNKVGIECKTNTMFGLLITVWFVVNELISILENAGRMGVELPKFLQNVLAELKKDIDQK